MSSSKAPAFFTINFFAVVGSPARLLDNGMIDIGLEIHNELLRQERSVTWLASKLGCDRQTIYRIQKRNSIDTHMLMRISVILNRDFFKELSEDYCSHV